MLLILDHAAVLRAIWAPVRTIRQLVSGINICEIETGGWEGMLAEEEGVQIDWKSGMEQAGGDFLHR